MWEPVQELLPDPGVDPGDAPLWCVSFNPAWLHQILGALLILKEFWAWDVSTLAELYTVVGRATDLIAMFALAGPCVQSGKQLVTITAGNAVGSAIITFPQAYATVANVTASSDSGLYIVSVSGESETGCTLSITARFDVLVDSSATVTWFAQGS